MIQSWNKFCFTGGILELSIQLPGKSDSGGIQVIYYMFLLQQNVDNRKCSLIEGIWPAAWLMGNLARPGHEKSTMYVWPWSYDKCGEIDDIHSKQKINACDGMPGNGMHPFQGRGAPEIGMDQLLHLVDRPNRMLCWYHFRHLWGDAGPQYAWIYQRCPAIYVLQSTDIPWYETRRWIATTDQREASQYFNAAMVWRHDLRLQG